MLKQIGMMGVAAALAAGLAMAPALAGQTSVSGTIDLDASSTRTADGAAALKYGDSAKFQTSYSGRMDPKGYMYVRVVCWTDPTNVVYQWSSRDLDFAFPLADQAGLQWDGEATTCQGDLVYRVDAKRNATIETVASTSFQVAGS